jgi:hypothetical protein
MAIIIDDDINSHFTALPFFFPLSYYKYFIVPFIQLVAMSDDDFMLEDEGYDFEYSSGEEDEAPDTDVENRYYNAKGKYSLYID